VEVGLHTATRAVDELVGDDQRTGAEVGAETTDGTRRDDLADTERTQRPHVRAVGDPVRGIAVVGAMARDERDGPSADFAEDRVAGRRAVRRLNRYGVGVVEERVEPRAA